MNIIIAGGSGFIGRPLCRALAEDGYQVTVLSRHPIEASGPLDRSIKSMGWNGRTGGDWERSLEGAEAVINLAGEPIADQRWTRDRKQALRESRIGTTRLLVRAFSHLSRRPTTLIVASGVGYYGPRDSTPVTERTAPGSDFLAILSRDCEHEAMQAEQHGLRVVPLRIGIVLGQDGGALPRMALPFRFFLGGPISPGAQWVSWIHQQDLIGLIRWIVKHPNISGPVNAVSPEPVMMREFCATLGKVMGRPCWLPVPEFALRLALGEMATILTTGQRVEPTVALSHGYHFQYPHLEAALHDILK